MRFVAYGSLESTIVPDGRFAAAAPGANMVDVIDSLAKFPGPIVPLIPFAFTPPANIA
jgi:hypothetical protein